MTEPGESRADYSAVDMVRRRLLASGGRYVAPAILMTLFLPEDALAQGSCMPMTCMPSTKTCGPQKPCGPAKPCMPGR